VDITPVGTPQSGSANNGGDVTLTFDEALDEGDVVYVLHGQADSGTIALGPSTSGYTELAKHDAAVPKAGVYRKVMGATPDSTVVLPGTGAGQGSTIGVCIALRGADATTPEDAATTTAGPTFDNNPNPAAVTTVTAKAWVLGVAASDGPDSSWSPISGYSNQVEAHGIDTFRINGALMTKEVATPGAEDPGAYTVGPGAENWYAFTVAVRPASLPSASLFATATGTTVDVVDETDATSDLHLSVDDDPDAPTDTDWVNNAVEV
jgi:hypothetical protein